MVFETSQTMQRWARQIAAIVVICLIAAAGPVLAEHDGKVQILLLGDSTTEGSIPRLMKPDGPHLETVVEQLLAIDPEMPPCHVINSGVSGEYIRRLIDSKRYAKQVADLPGLDYIFIRYGLNDRGRREDFVENFPKDNAELIAKLRADHPQAKLVLMTVIPYFDAEASKVINDLLREVAQQQDLPLFDIYPAYARALEAGPNMLNYRRYPVNRVPAELQSFVKPFIISDRVVVMANELDAILGGLPGWYGDRHPNLAGYNVIAVETVNYLKPLLQNR